MKFDLSLFPTIGKLILDTGVSIYKSLEFDFGDFSVNGWNLLLGAAILGMVLWFLGRIFE